MVGRRHTVSHPRHRTRGVAANPDHRNHRHCFLPTQNSFQQQKHQQQQQHLHSNPGSPSSSSAMTCTTAMTDSTLTVIEPRPSGADVTGPIPASLLVTTTSTTVPTDAFATAARNNSRRLKPCLSTGSGTSGMGTRTVGLETVTMRTAPQWKGSIQVLLKKDSVRSRNSFVCEL